MNVAGIGCYTCYMLYEVVLLYTGIGETGVKPLPGTGNQRVCHSDESIWEGFIEAGDIACERSLYKF